MAEQSYDLTIIGSGPGGYTAAIRAAQLGMSVALIEKDPALGGTCLNVGCIPSKALLESSEVYQHASQGLDAHGVKVGAVELDLAAMMERKAATVTALTAGVAQLMKKNKVECIQGTARIEAAGKVEVSGEQRLSVSSERILIATGSATVELAELPFDGERIVSSTEALSLGEVPGKMLVVGAGAIGLEMASIWNRLGAQVVVAEVMEQIVPGADRRSARTLQRSLKKQGIDIRLETSALKAEKSAGGVTVTFQSKDKESTDSYDIVLVAVGRRPDTAGLGCDEAGIATDEQGRVVVDERYETNIGGIFAIGDVIAGPMLAHKAEEEAVACVELMCDLAGQVNYGVMPAIVYTRPELATVGMSEEKAKEEGHEIRVGSFPFQANGRARCAGETDGMVRVIVDANADSILGVHIVGVNASELIAEATVAMELRASASDLGRTVHAHPTLAEAVKEAALAALGRALNI